MNNYPEGLLAYLHLLRCKDLFMEIEFWIEMVSAAEELGYTLDKWRAEAFVLYWMTQFPPQPSPLTR